jgi:hypothetical protein
MPLFKPFKSEQESKYEMQEKSLSKSNKEIFIDYHGYGGGHGKKTEYDYSGSDIPYTRLDGKPGVKKMYKATWC